LALGLSLLTGPLMMAQTPVASGGSAGTSVAPGAGDLGPAPEFRHVYIPADDLEVLFSGKPGTLLPRKEFLDLWRKAHPAGRVVASTEPNELLLLGADYKGTLGTDELAIDGVFRFKRMGAAERGAAGWTSWSLPLAGAAIRGAKLDGVGASLGLDDQGRLTLFAERPGDITLSLALSVPVVQGRDARLATFKLPEAPGRFELKAPPDTRLQLGTETIADGKPGGRPPEFPVPAGGEIRLTAVRGFTEIEKRSLLVASAETMLKLTPSQFEYRERIEVDARGGPLDTLTLRVPAGVQILGVSAPGLVRHDASPVDGGTALTLRFDRPWSGKRGVELTGAGVPALDADWPAPHATVVGAAAQSGRLSVRQDPALAVEVKTARHANRLRPEGNEPGYRFAGWRPDYEVQLRLRPQARRLASGIASLVTVARGRLELTSTLTVEPRGGSLFDLSLDLPAAWAVTAVRIGDARLQVTPVVAGERQRLDLNLPSPVPAGGSVALTVEADRSAEDWLREAGPDRSVPLPDVRLEGASEVEGVLMVRAGKDIRVQAEELFGYESVPIASVPGADDNVRLAYRWRSDRPKGRLDAALRTLRTAVEADGVVRVSDAELITDWRLRWQILSGTTDSLSFELAGVSANQVEVSIPSGAARIDGQTIEDLAGGVKRWRVKLDRDLDRSAELAVRVAVLRPEKGPIAVPPLKVPDVLRQSGAVTVERDPDREVRVAGESGLRTVDPGEIGAVAPGGTRRVVHAWQYRALPWELRLDPVKRDPVPVLTAAIRRLELVSVSDGSGQALHLARADLQNAGRQHLEVRLPKDGEMVSASLDGEPVEVRRGAGGHLIPVRGTGAGRTTMMVEMVFRGPGPSLGVISEYRQRPPTFDVPVLKVDWSVWLPEGQSLVWSDGGVEPVLPPSRDSLAGRLRDAVARRGSRRIFNPLEPLLPRSDKAAAKTDVRTAGAAPLAKSAAPMPPGAEVPQGSHMRDDVRFFPKGAQFPVSKELAESERGSEGGKRDESNRAPANNGLQLHRSGEPSEEGRKFEQGQQRQRGRSGQGGRGISGGMSGGGMGGMADPAADEEQSHQGQDQSAERPANQPGTPSGGLAPIRRNGGNDRWNAATRSAAKSTDGNAAERDGKGEFRNNLQQRENSAVPNEPEPAQAGGQGRFSGVSADAIIDLRQIILKGKAEDTEKLIAMIDAIERDGAKKAEIEKLMVELDSKGGEGDAVQRRLGEQLGAAAKLDGEDKGKLIASLNEQLDGIKERQTRRKTTANLVDGSRFGPRGLLSLRIDVDRIGQVREFTGLSGDRELVIGLQDDRFATILAWLTGTLLTAFGWSRRHWSGTAKVIATLSALLIATGLIGLVPVSMVFVLDGLLIGAFGWTALLVVRGLVGCVSRLPLRRELPAPGSVSVSALAPVLVGLALALVPGQARAEETPPKEPLPTIFLPYDRTKNPLDADRVFLPGDEFQRLLRLAGIDVGTDDPKIESALASAEYSGRLDGERARFDVTLSARIHRDQAVRVPLPVADAVLSEVSVDGVSAAIEPAPPREKPDSPSTFPSVLVSGRGTRTIRFRFDVAAERRGSTGSLKLALGRVAAARLSLELPEDGLEAAPSGLLGGWSLSGRRFEAAVHVGGNVGVAWRPEIRAAAAQALVSLQQKARLELSAAGARVVSGLEYLVRQGAVDRFELELADGVAVESASGPNLADWGVAGQGAARRLVLRTATPVTGAVPFEVRLFRAFDAASASEAGARADLPVGLNVTRESGQVLVSAAPGLEAAVRETTGMQRIGVSDFSGPAAPRADGSWVSLGAYRFAARPAALVWRSKARPGRLDVDVQHRFIVEDERVRTLARFNLHWSATPLVDVRFRLPVGFVTERVDVPDGVRWQQIEDPAGDRLEFERVGGAGNYGGRESMPVTIVGWVPHQAGAAKIPLTAPSVFGAARVVGSWQVSAARGRDLETVELSGLRAAGETGPKGAANTVPSATVWRQETSEARLAVRLTRLAPALTADVVSVLSVRDVNLAITTRVRFDIQKAATRSFRIELPEWMGQDVDVRGGGIRQIESQPTPTGRSFQIGLDREVMGRYDLTLTQVFPPPEDGVVRAPRIRPLGVERHREFVVVENRSPDQLDRVDAPGLRLETVENDQLPTPMAPWLKARAIDTVRLEGAAAEPRWRLRSSEKLAGLEASVNLAELTMAVDRDGGYRARFSARVNNRREQFLKLKLPANTTVWGLKVDDAAARPTQAAEDGADVYRIPIPRTAAGDLSSRLELVYVGRLDAFIGLWWRWSFPTPEVIGLPVAETQVRLHLPERYDYGSFTGNMDPADELYLTLSREATDNREAASILDQARYGKGAVKGRAISNVRQLQRSRSVVPEAPAAQGKGAELYQKVIADQRRLDEAARQVEADSGAASRDAEESDPFAGGEQGAAERADDPDEFAGAKPEADKAALGKGAAEDQSQVRSNLRRKLASQADRLNRAQQAKEQTINQTQTFDAPIDRGGIPDSQKQSLERGLDGPQRNQAGGDLGEPGGGRGQRGQSRAEATNLGRLTDSEGQSGGPANGRAFRAGALSMDLDLPTGGKVFRFVKPRGDAELGVVAYRSGLADVAGGAALLAAALIVLAVLVRALTRLTWVRRLAGEPAKAGAIAGLVWWLLLPGSAVGFLLLLASLLALAALAVRRRVLNALATAN
jgi:hypothetical protein